MKHEIPINNSYLNERRDFIRMKNLNSKFLIFIFTLVLAVVLCGAVSAATTTSYSSDGKIVNITSNYGKSTLQTHVTTAKKTGVYGYGTYSTVTFSGKDIKGRTSLRTITYFNDIYKTSVYNLTDHNGFQYNSKATAGKYKIFGKVTGRLNNGLYFSGNTTASISYLNGKKLVSGATGIIRFWQNGNFFSKVSFVDTPKYQLYNGEYQLVKVTETTNTTYANGNKRYSIISSYYTRNSNGVLTGQKTSGTSVGTETILNKTVHYTGKIYISTKYDPKDLFNEKYTFGDYLEIKTSSSTRVLKTYPYEAISFS